MREYLLQLAHYNLWANQLIVNAIPNDKKRFTQEVKSSFPTVEKTILHIWDAQDIWLSRLEDRPLTDWPSSSLKDRNQQSICEGLNHSSVRFFQFVDKQLPTFDTKIITYKNMQGVEYQNTTQEIIAHCMNHSTFHRGQLVSMLRELGVEKFSSTDMISYFRQLKEKKKEIYD
jgi:uncharacterized damage-inducible protein DinB